MKKYFLYELKKYLWTLVIVTAVCAIPYMVDLATRDMVRLYWEETGPGGYRRIVYSPNLDYVFMELAVLTFIVPAIVYSFKMSKRGVDGYYSLPLKKEKLYFVATMVGLILALVPFTVSYWGGFFTLLFRKNNPYLMGYYVPAYLGGLCFGIFMYGVNAFVFTRANRVSDGVTFTFAYALVAYLGLECLDYTFDVELESWRINNAFMFGGGMLDFVECMNDHIMGVKADTRYLGWDYGVTVGAGAISYGLLFLLLPLEKAENAEQNSDSWFGYKTLIPVYIALCLGAGAGEEIFGFAIIAVAGIVATVVYKRKFSLKIMDWLPLMIGLAAGVALMAV